jgi:hypothetical protein
MTLTDTQASVLATISFPSTFPFPATIGGDEKVQVTGYTGDGDSAFKVVRATDGTARVHFKGESFDYAPADTTGTTTPTPPAATNPPKQYQAWPAGAAYAAKLLALHQNPKRTFSLYAANVDGLWSKIEIGLLAQAVLNDEGPAGGISEPVRVIGFGPDEMPGVQEILVETV